MNDNKMYLTILFVFVGVLILLFVGYGIYYVSTNNPSNSGEIYCNANPNYDKMYRITASTTKCIYQNNDYDLYIIPVNNENITVASWLTSNQDVCGKYCYYNTSQDCYNEDGSISSN